MNIKTETWNGHRIRFVENGGEWWAVAADVAAALEYSHTPHMLRMIDDDDKGVHEVDTSSVKAKSPKTRRMSIISEPGLYEAAFNSQKPEAKDFKRWVFNVLKELREAAGLKGYEIFRMFSPEYQKGAMRRLHDGLREPKQHDYIKANTIANKAVSALYGLPKMVAKEQMTPEMLLVRQPILDDTVNLMTVNESFGMGISVSRAVYRKYCTVDDLSTPI